MVEIIRKIYLRGEPMHPNENPNKPILMEIHDLQWITSLKHWIKALIIALADSKLNHYFIINMPQFANGDRKKGAGFKLPFPPQKKIFAFVTHFQLKNNTLQNSSQCNKKRHA